MIRPSHDKVHFSSLCRIADLHTGAFELGPLPRDRWATGDYVLGSAEIVRGGFARVELMNGRIAPLVDGDLVVGALGVRHATLEVVGSWEAIGADNRMQMLTAAGLLGRSTSMSAHLPSLVTLDYRGHVLRDGHKVTMQDFAPVALLDQPYDCPTILIVGTSMSAGKTTTARILIRMLEEDGLKVTGCKLTGAGRYHDILSMGDAGAQAIFDFVDVGLPSSIGDAEAYRLHLRRLLAAVKASGPDVVVAEAGASPLEPYNGDTVMAEIASAVRCTVLCASDPYAVVGVMKGFDMDPPTFVAGLATSTSAGVEVVEKLAGVPAIDVLDRDSRSKLRGIVESALSTA